MVRWFDQEAVKLLTEIALGLKQFLQFWPRSMGSIVGTPLSFDLLSLAVFVTIFSFDLKFLAVFLTSLSFNLYTLVVF